MVPLALYHIRARLGFRAQTLGTQISLCTRTRIHPANLVRGRGCDFEKVSDLGKVSDLEKVNDLGKACDFGKVSDFGKLSDFKKVGNLKATFHLTISMRGKRATGKIQKNNYRHGSCGPSLTCKTSSVSFIFTHGTHRNVKSR